MNEFSAPVDQACPLCGVITSQQCAVAQAAMEKAGNSEILEQSSGRSTQSTDMVSSPSSDSAARFQRFFVADDESGSGSSSRTMDDAANGLDEISEEAMRPGRKRSSCSCSCHRRSLSEPRSYRAKRRRVRSKSHPPRTSLDDAYDEQGTYHREPSLRGYRYRSIGQSVSSEDVVSSMSSAADMGKFEKLLCKEFNRDELHSPVTNVPYKVLKKITKRFGDDFNKYNSPAGLRLGAGGTGTVFLGEFSDGYLVAVKRLDRDKVRSDLITRQFVMEVENVAKFRHPNIMEILGYSADGPFACIVYDYLPEGSVLDHLMMKRGKTFLTAADRLRIARETADGLNFLHTGGPLPLVHRDVKGANILLDWNLTAKLGDYGFAMYGDPRASMRVSVVVGTQAYMAPEAYYGDVSVKLDTYGFGVVLLELLTGMPGYDDKKSHPGVDLLEFIRSRIGANHREILPYCDRAAGWKEFTASSLGKIAMYCVREKQRRPTMEKVLDAIQALEVIDRDPRYQNERNEYSGKLIFTL